MNTSDSKEVLLDKLIGIQDIETAKQLEEIDTDLISECSEYIIELTGEHLPPEYNLEQMKRKLLYRLIGRNKVSGKGLLRKLLIAAIVVILIIAMSISMIPLGGGDESLLSRWSYYLLHQKQGEEKEFGDYLSIRQEGGFTEFKSIRQFVRKTNLDVLVPTKTPKELNVQRVFLYYDSVEECPIVNFVTNDPMQVSIGVNIGKETDELEKLERMERIGTYDCGVSFSDRQCHCEFNYNGNGYFIDANSFEDVELIITNMKGSLK